ncbi:peptidoglycan-binding protein [Actinotalea sp. M2MS4P-6]|uniref:peptidoglycan-binding domain-containing protein n=1 Tax=Actinotalea sp. M2MS4P-6 TaxID=2983762 RepID=UPI0021E47B46|nr:peptidoglycan-binding domain-containing protein [Actinotalea sp. M2MS4P-6]MCV2396198.1 peptidoglycan-binding protein [Actinotalea sp. M2MS4P-6]
MAMVLGGLMLMTGGQAATAAVKVAPAPAAASAVLPASSPIITSECQNTYLHYGSRGECVRQLQFAMNIFFNRGLAEDGIYGPATTSAVYWFQARYGLTYDGRCGPQTWLQLLWVNIRFNQGLPY